MKKDFGNEVEIIYESWSNLQQNGPCDVRQGLVTEFACLGRIQASVTCVIILARKALVQVETLFLLGASFEEVKFTKLHDLWWIGVVRVMTCLCILWILAALARGHPPQRLRRRHPPHPPRAARGPRRGWRRRGRAAARSDETKNNQLI